jgi:hypothetical protein
MATTTNYGWTTPDDTALVKDGASAIRTLGSSVDTTTKNLNPETTLGDLSFRSSTSNVNTRIPIGSSGQHLTVVAGVPAWSTASDQTPLTTKGDLFTFSTIDARLGVGANGTTLVANSATATGLEWQAASSGGMTSLASGSLSSLSTLDLTSISQSYVHLQLCLIDWELSADSNLNLRINNESQNYYFMSGQTGINSGSTTTTALYSMNINSLLSLTGAAADAGAYRNLTVVNAYNYTSTIFALGDVQSQSKRSTGADELFDSQWTYNRTTNNAPITELNIFLDSGNFTNGTYVLYGVK